MKQLKQLNIWGKWESVEALDKGLKKTAQNLKKV